MTGEINRNFDNAEGYESSLDAQELTAAVAPGEYSYLYLLAHGYNGRLAGEMLQMSVPQAEAVRNRVYSNLLVSGKLSNVQAVAKAVDIGFLPDPAEQPDDTLPKLGRFPDSQGILPLLLKGASDQAISDRLGLSLRTTRREVYDLKLTLNASTRPNLVWRAYQAKLVRPSQAAVPLPDSYHQALHQLEERAGGPIISSVYKRPTHLSRHEIGNQKLEDFTLHLVDAPDFAIYHPHLAIYFRHRYGYDRSRWRNHISQLGNYGITALQRSPDANAAHGIKLLPAGLDQTPRRPFITDHLLETYERRLAGERPEFQIDTSHLGIKFKQLPATELSPALRAVIGLAQPVIEKEAFVSPETKFRTLSTFTGQTQRELIPVLGKLKSLGLISANVKNLSLTGKGRQLLEKFTSGVGVANEPVISAEKHH